MFAVVRTGGKQYRVAAGDKIAVEKIAGEAGDTVTLDDVLLAGEGADVKAGNVTVSAEIIAQAKGEKVIVFKKRRRHNYRRKKGHRQQYTILRITAIGDQKAEKKAAPKKAAKADAPVAQDAPLKVEGAEGQIDTPAKAKAKKETAKTEAKPAEPAKKAATAAKADAPKKASTKKAAPAKGAAKGE
ncbi:50S ribosomal protein L21 [Sphingosinicella sp. YJ22]|uniref:50S ribosomal protein L21 n=1 Tax=Sphingosinicella sp. YJ22 TaxID=1104780 RepID=UPI00140E1079|nr:50S ribosomal protein L21 [Sphingosinicella sp. YJ22]